ncbi:hypothetical protein MGA5115_02148 [Marinomonas gallaica]|uniref:Uncharacterized protein n=2 Tax=Marinomonas gallaica TaxID=1806667 RepID=A0A1C3JSK4_9GAMM|nr:hypothetical protein MGA5115_02148 [Marinomonas gallaica]SBT19862.1 hypothetical protein MGA5116_00445 [Marinomonas gallaica]
MNNMNKSKMLNAYKSVNNLKGNPQPEEEKETKAPKIYRSEYDEKLIKEYHFAKFQKNLDLLQNNQEVIALLKKEEWDEEDIKTLLASFR